MKKIIIAGLLAISVTSVFAEWTPVYVTDSGTFNIDYETLRKEGSTRKVWILLNYKQQQIDNGMSRRVRYEFDCKEERYRALTFSVHSESMANGELIYNSSSVRPWEDPPPDTAIASMMKKVCAK